MDAILQNFVEAEQRLFALQRELFSSTNASQRASGNRELLLAYQKLEMLARVITGFEPHAHLQFAKVG